MKVLFIQIILVINAFGQGIFPVSDLSLNSDDNQFKVIDHFLGDSELLGIGESAHGVSEFLNARYRLTKYFITNHNYRLLLLEAGYIKTENINNYINACSHNNETNTLLSSALSSLDFIYKNEETKKFIIWLCEYNKYHPDKAVAFHGIDQWENPWVNRDILAKGIALTEDKDYEKYFNIARDNCFAWQIDNWRDGSSLSSWDYLLQTWRLIDEEHRLCLGSLYNLKNVMAKYQHLSANDVFWINLALKVSYVYEQYRDSFVTDITRALNLRDDLQAFLVSVWYQKYKLKTIILEHNLHIAKEQSRVVPPNVGDLFKWINVRSTGENLIGLFGREYQSIAITGHDIESSRDGQYKVDYRDDNLDYHLSQKINGKFAIVNPNAYFVQSLGKWWLHNENTPFFLNPKEQYDLLFFVKESQAAINL